MTTRENLVAMLNKCNPGDADYAYYEELLMEFDADEESE